MHHRAILVLAALAFTTSLSGAIIGDTPPGQLPLFPRNNWWNLNISNAPVDANSSAYIGTMSSSQLHPDFGDSYLGHIIGFPWILVDGVQPKVAVTFQVPEESDGVAHNTQTSFAFYPIPTEAINESGWIEYGDPGSVDSRNQADRHMLIVDGTNNYLYEIYNVWYSGTRWEAYSGAFFNMNTNDRRPDTWTSADAAGLAILPGLVRYDEVYGPDEINHAFRVTMSSTNGYVYPASHAAGSTAGRLPMGARLRLKPGTDISSKPAAMQKIFRAMMKYGLLVADNGSNMYVSGTHDSRWDGAILNTAFHSLHASDFEVVQLGWNPSYTFVMTVPGTVGSGDPTSVTVTAYKPDYTVATSYVGTVHFSSTDGSATLPSDFVFTTGDNGTHTFNNVVFRTSGHQAITVRDTVDANVTALRIVSVGPPAPTALVATATSTTQVGLTWTASSGGAQYEIARGTTLANIVPIATTVSTAYTDSGRTAGTTYLYRVRAIDASSVYSPYTAVDAATTVVFTDDPVAAASTRIKAVHITELRTAINAMRTAAVLPQATFTDPTLTGVKVKAVHVQEIRNALNDARTALGLAALTLTDSTLTTQLTKVKAAHVQELRNGVK